VCHIGTDTISLARLGARMSRLDSSGPAIDQAQSFADRLGLEVDFHQADVYDAVAVLGEASYDPGMDITGLTEHNSAPWEALPAT
jgi:2-polyprenyl-3-methyl-5-hydroxy-6-metoxy-1,4-benzoquinol methylase